MKQSVWKTLYMIANFIERGWDQSKINFKGRKCLRGGEVKKEWIWQQGPRRRMWSWCTLEKGVLHIILKSRLGTLFNFVDRVEKSHMFRLKDHERTCLQTSKFSSLQAVHHQSSTQKPKPKAYAFSTLTLNPTNHTAQSQTQPQSHPSTTTHPLSSYWSLLTPKSHSTTMTQDQSTMLKSIHSTNSDIPLLWEFLQTMDSVRPTTHWSNKPNLLRINRVWKRTIKQSKSTLSWSRSSNDKLHRRYEARFLDLLRRKWINFLRKIWWLHFSRRVSLKHHVKWEGRNLI